MDAEQKAREGELKPCPFCGAAPRTITLTVHFADGTPSQRLPGIECSTYADDRCHAHVVADTVPAAIAAWNTRAGEEALRAELEHLRPILELARSGDAPIDRLVDAEAAVLSLVKQRDQLRSALARKEKALGEAEKQRDHLYRRTHEEIERAQLAEGLLGNAKAEIAALRAALVPAEGKEGAGG